MKLEASIEGICSLKWKIRRRKSALQPISFFQKSMLVFNSEIYGYITGDIEHQLHDLTSKKIIPCLYFPL